MGNKPYNCNSTNSKMSGGVGAIKSYEKGGLVTDPRAGGPRGQRRTPDQIRRRKESDSTNAYNARKEAEVSREQRNRQMDKNMKDGYNRFYGGKK
jgi:hypothetical protein